MGREKSITATTFPPQGRYLNARAQVCFHYDTSAIVRGTVVRDDRADPFLTIIRLDDGRHVLATECMYSTDDVPPSPSDIGALPPDHAIRGALAALGFDVNDPDGTAAGVTAALQATAGIR